MHFQENNLTTSSACLSGKTTCLNQENKYKIPTFFQNEEIVKKNQES